MNDAAPQHRATAPRPAQHPPEGGVPQGVVEGDCLEVLRTLRDGCIATVVTSPPYNLRETTGNSSTTRGPASNWPESTILRQGYDGHEDQMPYPDYVAWQREVLGECMRVLSEDGAIFYNHKWRVQDGLLQNRSDIVDGFPVRQIIIWARAGGLNFNVGYFVPTYEVIYLIAKPAWRLRDKSIAGWGDVWRIRQEHASAHPAPFPVEIPQRCIDATGRGPVLDPFLGSGTTGVAAERLGLPWCGIEHSPRYAQMARERVKQAAQRELAL